MEKHTMTEADQRNALIQGARTEFITGGTTKNISEALQLFIKAHPEKCAGIPATISTREKDRPRTIIDEYERPKCKKCGAPLFWQNGCSACKGPVKKNRWVCKACGFARITKDTLEQALGKLEKKRDG